MTHPTLIVPALLTLLAGGCVWVGYLTHQPEFSIPVAGVLVLSAYGLFMRWVRLNAATGGAVVRFLEQVRRAIAFENPDQPARQPNPNSEPRR
jgi:hypothetical protein